MYPSSGPYIPPTPDCPGEGADPPPPFMVEAAVGRICVVVGVEEVVALPVELEEVEFEVDIGWIVVNTDVAMTVLPAVTNVERDVDVTTANDCEGDGDGDGDDDEVEFVEF
jgi:hypothetical protein